MIDVVKAEGVAHTEELEHLCLALAELPIDWVACSGYLQLIDAEIGSIRMQEARHRALLASVEPGFQDLFTPDHADEVLRLVDRFSILQAAQAAEHQQRMDAFSHARQLIDELGMDDQQTVAAVVAAIEIADPEHCVRRIAQMAGVH